MINFKLSKSINYRVMEVSYQIIILISIPRGVGDEEY